MRVRLSLAAGVLGLTLGACDGTAGNPEAEAGVAGMASAEAQAVKDLETRFIAGWEAKNPEVKSFYAPNAVMVAPNVPPHESPTAIAAAFDRFAANSNAALDFNNATTVISTGGDLAFSQGTYTARHTNPDTRAIQTSKGYYLVVYKKQPDGGWKVVQDVSSPLP